MKYLTALLFIACSCSRIPDAERVRADYAPYSAKIRLGDIKLGQTVSTCAFRIEPDGRVNLFEGIDFDPIKDTCIQVRRDKDGLTAILPLADKNTWRRGTGPSGEWMDSALDTMATHIEYVEDAR